MESNSSNKLNENYNKSEVGGPSALYEKPTPIIGTIFFLDERFEIIDTIGSGAFGIVVSARDKTNGEMVAIKRIEKAFEHLTYAKRTLRELKILRLLSHENMMRIQTIQLPRTKDGFEEIYIVTELMATDLSSVIKSPQPLSDEHVQFLLYQLLRGLKYMHSACVVHRDLKPRNILVNGNCDLKICDFGLARPIFNDMISGEVEMTDYVATRWYRAPEVLLRFKKYSTPIDIWAVGCIFGELFLRKPLLPGKDNHHQIELIFNLLGTPSDEDIEAIPNMKSKEKVLRMRRKPKKNLDSIFSEKNQIGVDLMRKMLMFNPDKRITVDQALQHPYLAVFHCPFDEPTAKPIEKADFDFEDQNLSIKEYKELVYDEILFYHSSKMNKDS